MATGGQQQLVAKLARLMADAVPEAAAGAESGGAVLCRPLNQGAPARALREISRISMRYGWWSAVEVALDRARVPSLRHLETTQLEALAEHLQGLVENAMTACDLADDLPAR